MTTYQEARRLAMDAANALIDSVNADVEQYGAELKAEIESKAIGGGKDIRVADAPLDAPREIVRIADERIEGLPAVMAAAVPDDTPDVEAVRRVFAEAGKKLAAQFISELRLRLEHGRGVN